MQEELLEAVKVLQDAELEELLKWRLYLAVMDVVRKCYKRRDAGEFSVLLQKLETNRNSAHIWRIRDRKNPEAGVERIIQTAGSVKRSACSIVLRMARVNSNIYAEMIVENEKIMVFFLVVNC